MGEVEVVGERGKVIDGRNWVAGEGGGEGGCGGVGPPRGGEEGKKNEQVWTWYVRYDEVEDDE